MQKKIVFLVSMMMCLCTSMMAQVTTSAMSGKVTLEGTGEELIGATVQAVHEPSGTTYSAVTNVNGRFNIQGMRTGGPYAVTVSYVGHQTKIYKDITLQLGEVYNLGVTLSEDAAMLGEVIVSATASKFAQEKTGASTNINNSQMMNLPTVSRSITDITRLSPYGGHGMSFVGTDGRTANFTVDGANFNNNFGLSPSLPGGGNPISIEAIEELQVVIAPYDVRQTNFIGGGVNAITKSGTNAFKGSAYVYHRNENMRGDAVEGFLMTNAREKDRKTTYGFTLGGPIIKNKLFFFVNGETEKVPTVANRWRASEDGVANVQEYISRTTAKDLQTVSDFVNQKYGYNTGSYTSFPADISNTKLLARLDWNITDQHRLALRYNYTKNMTWRSPNASSMDGGTRMSEGRLSQASMAYANTMYSMDNLVHSFSFDLNSRLTENLSNQLLATYSKLDDLRSSNSSEFPFIDILKKGQAYLSLGYELFTWNNAVHNDVWNVKDELTYYAGKHKITGGLAYEYKMADNAYMRNGTGYYRYSSLDDFINGAAPEIVNLTYGYGGESAPAARVRSNKISVYGQDEWSVKDNFKLVYGLRIDNLSFVNSDLITNKAIYDLDYDGRRIDTGKWPSANWIFSPRVGFTWDVLGNKSLKVRGGTGLFAGNLPLVFFTNMPTNGGMVQYQAQINAANAAKRGFDMDTFAGGLVTDANGKATQKALYDKLISLGYPSTIKPEDGTVPSAIAAVSENFKLPQVWKASLAIDYQVPVSFPFTLSGEFIFNKTLNETSISDWSIPSVGGFARLNGVDNRPIYPTGFRTNTKAFVLENTSRGYGWTANLTANVQPAEWVSLMAAYTHNVAKSVTGMPGSNAESAFTYVPTVEGPNHIKLHNSQYNTPDRLVASATIHDKSGNHYSLFYEGWRGGANYSFMTTNDMNGDGYNYDAIYIPTDQQVADKQFRFVSEDDKTRFMDYVHANGYLSKHQGEYAEAYALYSPWVHRIDFAYKHDFKLNVGKTKHGLQLSFDIKNLLNLFDSKWGVAKYLNPAIGSDARILKYEGVDTDGVAKFSTPESINGNIETFTPSYSIGQCWYMSVGIKYTFN
ncbi:carboxypeptidase regulatory-like domain protein [Prevotella sp. BV3P1]|uniref:TonB-dependent receptor n=1 Tax=Prevotellaceae TaxID=171552 RepID=UPI0003B8D22D|nr:MULTISPECIES: TonB-dependent receptor [Prevotellaceae]ERT61279.1 carboxypeptidase regulatory-like domain protein [Prevotella sp. BV3P1]KGF41335.1 TonB-dependent receptor [Hoylesella buccalis DNF00985]